jgi:hypothetical protein
MSEEVASVFRVVFDRASTVALCSSTFIVNERCCRSSYISDRHRIDWRKQRKAISRERHAHPSFCQATVDPAYMIGDYYQIELRADMLIF